VKEKAFPSTDIVVLPCLRLFTRPDLLNLLSDPPDPARSGIRGARSSLLGRQITLLSLVDNNTRPIVSSDFPSSNTPRGAVIPSSTPPLSLLFLIKRYRSATSSFLSVFSQDVGETVSRFFVGVSHASKNPLPPASVPFEPNPSA